MPTILAPATIARVAIEEFPGNDPDLPMYRVAIDGRESSRHDSRAEAEDRALQERYMLIGLNVGASCYAYDNADQILAVIDYSAGRFLVSMPHGDTPDFFRLWYDPATLTVLP